MCAAVSFMARHVDEWRKPKTIRFLSDRLESVAFSLETAPWTRRSTRKWSLRVGCRSVPEQVAAHIRELIVELNRAMTEEEYREVLRSLTCGVAMLAADDWDRIREVVKHIGPAPSRLRRWILHNVLPALVLVAFAVTLPLLPGLHEQSASVIGLRLTLGISALVRLLPSSLSIADVVSAAMQSAVSSRK